MKRQETTSRLSLVFGGGEELMGGNVFGISCNLGIETTLSENESAMLYYI